MKKGGKKVEGAGEMMGQQLRALTILVYDLNSGCQHPHGSLEPAVIAVSRDLLPSSDLLALYCHHLHTWFTDINEDKTITDKKLKNVFI